MFWMIIKKYKRVRIFRMLNSEISLLVIGDTMNKESVAYYDFFSCSLSGRMTTHGLFRLYMTMGSSL